MKKLMVLLSVLFWTGAWSQGSSVQQIRQNFTYLLRAAEQPCPETLRPVFPRATCYRHGYDDFFDFKNAATPYLFELGGRLGPWRVVTLDLGGGTAEAFQVRYRPRGEARRLTLTWVGENLLVLEVRNVRPSP